MNIVQLQKIRLAFFVSSISSQINRPYDRHHYHYTIAIFLTAINSNGIHTARLETIVISSSCRDMSFVATRLARCFEWAFIDVGVLTNLKLLALFFF